MSDLTEFLLARIAEDESDAWWVHHRDCATNSAAAIGGFPCDCIWPKRVTADCEAKRRIVARHTQKVGENLPRHPICAECGGADWRPEGGVLQPFPWVMPWPCHTLRALAAVYADHPDYREEWRP